MDKRGQASEEGILRAALSLLLHTKSQRLTR